MIRSIQLSKRAKQGLRKAPSHVARKLQQWVDDIEETGLEEVRKRPGWHDEPLKGDRLGQRSIRLNIAYRAIYEIRGERMDLIKVSKHEY